MEGCTLKKYRKQGIIVVGWPLVMVMVSPRPSAFPHFRFQSVSRKPMGDLFYVVHTHPSGGVDVPFRG